MPDDDVIEDASEASSENEYDEIEGDKDEHDDDMMAEQRLDLEDGRRDGASETKKSKLDMKDPSRPKRKKARRACFACQRAHLTCGDERPCQRCIKRGLADACQDGVRKKAKYLHDAPPEALRPVLGPTYDARNNGRAKDLSRSTSASDTSPGTGTRFPQSNPSPQFQMQYQSMRNANPMPPPLTTSLSFTDQQAPLSPAYANASNQRSVRGYTPTSSTNMDVQNTSAYGGPLFDPSNPALFNFDLEGLNFGNHYGALEFGMLNHMSSGAAETPPHDQNGSMSQTNDIYNTNSVFSRQNSLNQYGQLYSQDPMMPDFGSIDQQNSFGTMSDVHRNMPRAFAIESGHNSIASPSTDAHNSPQSLGFDSSPTTNYNAASGTHSQGQGPPHRLKRQDSKPTPKFSNQTLIKEAKRTRDPSAIYSSVTEPYPYTAGFHNLTAIVQRRFGAVNTLKIAKSLASIRPSFIGGMMGLGRQDLIFMEKCFQRTLFEFEGFMQHWGTPTLVCRRTGEVAAVNKEFTLLTGWTKNVLLGKEPNMNVNAGMNNNKGEQMTPRLRAATADKPQDNKPHSVFLAEIFDDDSVIEFYEDFAKLAFADSRNSVMRRCKILKYQTKHSTERADGREDDGPTTDRKRDMGPLKGMGAFVTKIDGEHGIGHFLEKDGKMDCAYCWTVKRDVFDIPMLIIMNFLPCMD